MCGLVGMYGYIGPDERDTFQDLLDLDIIRGHHSTGVAFIPDGKEPVSTLKAAVFPYELMRWPEFQEKMDKDNLALIGHNRAATKGDVNDENAHPFTHGHITLAHNGTLLGKWRMLESSRFDTDSEALTFTLKERGIDYTYKNLDGAAALSWWDDDDCTLNLITNGQRPLHICVVNEGATIIWASTKEILNTCVNRRNLKVVKNTVYKLSDHQLFTFTLDENGLVKEESRKLDPFRFNVQNQGQYLGRKAWDDYEDGYGLYSWPNQRPYEPKEKKEKEKDVSYGKDLKVPKLNGKSLTKDKFMEMFEKVNCIFCGENVGDEYGECTIIDDWTAACHECTNTANDFGITVA